MRWANSGSWPRNWGEKPLSSSRSGATPASNALTADAILADPTKCPSYPAAWDPTCVNAAGALAVGNANPADDWCDACVLLDVDNVAIVTTYGVTVPIAASAKDSVEAALANSMSTAQRRCRQPCHPPPPAAVRHHRQRHRAQPVRALST
jgi:hypothetical protein